MHQNTIFHDGLMTQLLSLLQTLLSARRRLPSTGPLRFGTLSGLMFGGLMCLYKTQASDYIKEITRKSWRCGNSRNFFTLNWPAPSICSEPD